MIPIGLDFLFVLCFCCFLLFFRLFLCLFDYLCACFLAWLTASLNFRWLVYSLVIIKTLPFLIIVCLVNHLNNQSHQTAALLRIWSLLKLSRLPPPSIEPRGSLPCSQGHRTGP